MSDLAEDPQSRRHGLSDWLALHELDPETCRRLLGAAAREDAGGSTAHEEPGPAYQALDLEVAWRRTVQALRALLPEQRALIDETFACTAKILVARGDKPRKALTLDNGPGAYPTIVLSYGGEPYDALVVAHEFGHALQISASRGAFMAPVMREVCAFLGESALLTHMAGRDPARHAHLVQVWRSDNRRYFGVQRDRLLRALSQPEAPYAYSWNYPIARYLALQISRCCSRDRIWNIYEGQVSLRALLRELSPSPS